MLACQLLQVFHQGLFRGVLALYELQVVSRVRGLLKSELEVRVHELVLVRVVADFSEFVHVELPHERREATGFEVLWEHFLGELVGLVDDKAVSFLVPGDNAI